MLFSLQRTFLHRHFHPGRVQSRFLIVRREILSPAGGADLGEPNYIDNKELTEIDRRVIAGTQQFPESLFPKNT